MHLEMLIFFYIKKCVNIGEKANESMKNEKKWTMENCVRENRDKRKK